MHEEAWAVERIAAGWWAYHELGDDREARVRRERPADPEAEEAVAAWKAVTDATWQGGPRAIELMRALARTAYDENRVGHVAGAMQNLLMENGADLAPDLVELASNDERMAEVLRSTWVLDESLEEATYRLLDPWMPLLSEHAIRPPSRPRPKGRRWRDRGAPGVSRWTVDGPEA